MKLAVLSRWAAVRDLWLEPWKRRPSLCSSEMLELEETTYPEANTSIKEMGNLMDSESEVILCLGMSSVSTTLAVGQSLFLSASSMSCAVVLLLDRMNWIFQSELQTVVL